MKKTILRLFAVLSIAFILLSPSYSFAASMNNCTVTQVTSTTSGAVYLTVTYNSTEYNLIMPASTPQSNYFLATALTALSSPKPLNIIVGQIQNWATIASLTITH